MKKRIFFLLTIFLSLTACSNWTPLSSAAYDGDIAGMQKALDSGAEINPLDQGMITPLYWATTRNHPEAVAFLLDEGAKIERYDIFLATRMGDEMAMVFSSHIAEDAPYLDDFIYLALALGLKNTFFDLINKGVAVPLPNPKYLGQEMRDIVVVDNWLRSKVTELPKYDAMTLAVAGGSKSIVNHLILMPVDWRLDVNREVVAISEGGNPSWTKKDANLLCIWSKRRSFYYEEKTGNDLKMFTSLIKANDDEFDLDTLSYFVNKNSINSICQNDGGPPILAAALLSHSTQIVKQLIALGADPFIVANSGNTLLHYSTASKNPDLVKYAISIGLNPRARNNDGDTAYDFAVKRKWTEGQRILAPYDPKQTDTSSDDLMGKLAATAGLIAVGSQANLSSEQMNQFVTAATQDVWLNDGKSNNLAQLQQSTLTSSSKSASSPSGSTSINKAHGPKKPLRNQGVCKDYTIDNYKDANLIGEPQIDTLCATGIVHYRVYLANYGRSDADAKELEKVYQAHVYSMETANKVDKATQMPTN
ncbi:ankyrin repeat domain-containing protein [Vibrio fluvialis]|nr:ankyrin repeat domain-containing protein [Vibrio fluvialis]